MLGDLWGLVGSPLRYLYELEQSPQVRHLCGLRSCGGQSGTEGALPGAAQEMEMAPGVQVAQSVVTGAGKRDVEQQQDMVWHEFFIL